MSDTAQVTAITIIGQGERTDGYHLLQTLLPFLDYGDTIDIVLRNLKSLMIEPYVQRAYRPIAMSNDRTLTYSKALKYSGAADKTSADKQRLRGSANGTCFFKLAVAMPL